MFIRSGILRNLHPNLARLVHQVKSSPSESTTSSSTYVGDFCQTAFIQEQESAIQKWAEEPRMRNKTSGHQLYKLELRNIIVDYFENNQRIIMKMKRESVNARLQEKHNIFSSLLPTEAFFLEDLVRFNFRRNVTTSENSHYQEANNCYTVFVLNVMRYVAYQLWGLHNRDKVYANMNPQNVMISKPLDLEESAKDVYSTSLVNGGIETLCWKAPEQHLDKTQTSASDMFSFGCVLYFCLTGGGHPFGKSPEEIIENVRLGKNDLSQIQHIPEAFHLISRLLCADPESRLNAQKVLHHPLFWSPSLKIRFLDQVLDNVTDEKLASAIPILGHTKWAKMYRCLNEVYRGRSGDYSKYNTEFIFGPCRCSGFIAELVMSIFNFANPDCGSLEKSFLYMRFREYDDFCLHDDYLSWSSSDTLL